VKIEPFTFQCHNGEWSLPAGSAFLWSPNNRQGFRKKEAQRLCFAPLFIMEKIRFLKEAD
jgi:hypothetical protein